MIQGLRVFIGRCEHAGLPNLHPGELIPRAFDPYVRHGLRKLRIQRRKVDGPAHLAARELQAEEPLERRSITRQRRANAFDERQELRVRLQVQRTAAAAALHRHRLSVHHQGFHTRFDRALFQPVGSVVDQFTGGLHRPLQQRQELLLDETDFAMAPLRQGVHDFVQSIARCGCRSQQRDANAEQRELHGCGLRVCVGSRQKSKKLNQL
jgi:hypothetical protein